MKINELNLQSLLKIGLTTPIDATRSKSHQTNRVTIL
ncbi:Uncharacterised protein [Vibrio cholerae]|nr:Uncharacterised protein [Vibrio cholerae]